jgi:hypothetical protein
MNMTSLLLGALFMLGLVMADQAPAAAPKNPKIEALCKTVLCRPPSPIRLRLKDGKVFESVFPQAVPIVSGEMVTILPEETVMVEAKLENGFLVELMAVSKIVHPERTLVFNLKQESSIGDGIGMILTVKSPFPGALKYRLGMMLPSSDRILKTSSCPVDGGGSNLESWPHPIFQLVATGFHIVKADSEEGRRCE